MLNRHIHAVSTLFVHQEERIKKGIFSENTCHRLEWVHMIVSLDCIFIWCERVKISILPFPKRCYMYGRILFSFHLFKCYIQYPITHLKKVLKVHSPLRSLISSPRTTKNPSILDKLFDIGMVSFSQNFIEDESKKFYDKETIFIRIEKEIRSISHLCITTGNKWITIPMLGLNRENNLINMGTNIFHEP